jgi:signal transduction histidine kinase
VLLAATAILAVVGLATDALPLVVQPSTIWPWQYTELILHIGLVAMIVLPVLALSRQQYALLRLHAANLDLACRVQEGRRFEDLNSVLDQRVREHIAALEEENARLQAQNRRLEELQKVTHQFVDNVSHEFRTPLTVIQEYAAELKEAVTEETSLQRVHEFPNVILHRVHELRVMVDDLLDISRLESGILRMARRACHVTDIVQQVFPMLEQRAARHEVGLKTALEDNLPRVFCDPEKVKRVLTNLIVNALKFTEPGGHVQLWARAEPDAAEVHVGVTDNGPGIPPDKLELIFERFSQLDRPLRRSTNGFGLGLSIVKELVTLNLGDVHVRSAPGAGTVFWFTLPIADHVHVFERYLQRLQGHLSLLCIDADCTAPGRLTEVHAFLENQLRRTDLLFTRDDGGWLLAAATDQEGAGNLIRRVLRALVDVNCARAQDPLPELQLGLCGTWCADGHRKELLQSFATLVYFGPGVDCDRTTATP